MLLIEKVKSWLKETTNKVVISLITAGVLTILGLVYSNKSIYAAAFHNFIFAYWSEILLILLTVGLIWLFLKLVRLENGKSVSSAARSNLSIEEVQKLINPIQASISKQESNFSWLRTKITSFEDDVLDLKRDHLYQKAYKHEQLNQRGALLCRLGVVELDIKDGDDYNLQDSLNELYSYVKRDKHFETKDLSDEKNALTPIKNDGHKVIVEEILSQIKSKLI